MHQWPLTLVLSPLLLLQGIYVRFKTPRLPEAEGERVGTSAMNDSSPNNLEPSGSQKSLSFKIFGDSAAAGVGATHQEEALSGAILKHLGNRYLVSWQLEAWSGCTTLEMLAHINQLPSEKVDLVVTSLGVNDLITGVKSQTWLKQQHRLVELIREKFSPQMIILSALPEMKRFPALPQPLRFILGSRAELFNKHLKSFVAAQKDCFHLRLDIADTPALMATDGFHPGPAAYQLWGEAVASVVEANHRVIFDPLSEGNSLPVCSN